MKKLNKEAKPTKRSIAARARRAKPLPEGKRPRIDGKAGKPNDVSWHPKFLEVLAKTSNVAASCRAVGIRWGTAQEHREKFEDFRLAWHECEQMGVEELHALAVDHALNGTLKPVYQQGDHVGDIREYDHRLLEWLLQRKRPSEFGDKKEIAVKESVVTMDDLQEKLKQSAALRETLGKMLAEAS